MSSAAEAMIRSLRSDRLAMPAPLTQTDLPVTVIERSPAGSSSTWPSCGGTASCCTSWSGGTSRSATSRPCSAPPGPCCSPWPRWSSSACSSAAWPRCPRADCPIRCSSSPACCPGRSSPTPSPMPAAASSAARTWSPRSISRGCSSPWARSARAWSISPSPSACCWC